MYVLHSKVVNLVIDNVIKNSESYMLMISAGNIQGRRLESRTVLRAIILLFWALQLFWALGAI